ncbi:hypothetical protein ACSMXN_09200 [Jatrophihabitans sp. DSM 45814]
MTAKLGRNPVQWFVVLLVVSLCIAIFAVKAGSATTSTSCSKTDDGTNETITCPSSQITATQTVVVPGPTVTLTLPPLSSPIGSTAPSSSAPSQTPTPSPTPTSPSTITNGQQINPSNVGIAAWVGPNGETCTSPKVYTAKVSASSLGASVTCAWFKKGVTIDRDISITAARFDTSIDTNGHTVNLNWVNVDTVTAEDIAIHGDGTYNLFRCSVTGSSDALRFEGDNVVESYLRTKAESSSDHNDAIQAYQADAGGSILRSNIDAKPVNAAQFGIGAGNGAIFLADNSKGNADIEDNYLAGGGYTLRLNESMIYTHVKGNVIVKGSYLFGPLDTTNSVKGAFPDWSGNTLSDGTPIPAP